MTKTTIGLDSLPDAVGRQLGQSEWRAIEQRDIDQFAETTHDHQWIHVDPERAARGPFGATIAHGYLVLSLCAVFLEETLDVADAGTVVNYGLDRVRFVSPVRAGSRVRGTVELVGAEPAGGGGVRAVVRVTVELEGSPKPACVADGIALYLP